MDHEKINAFMVELSTDPGLQSLLRSGSAALLWRASPLTILWASPAAEDLAGALVSDGAGTVSSSFPAHAQIVALATGRAPRSAHRLEKLRFETSALAPLSTCACRLLTLPDGEEVLLTAFLGKPPRLPPSMNRPARDLQQAEAAPETSRLDVEHSEPEQSSVEIYPEAEPSVMPAKRIVRFLWEADAQGRFLSVSDSLAEVVGENSAAIVGMTIEEVLAARAHDPLDIVAELFARGETWSGRKLYWRIGETNEAVQIDLAGLTVHDRARNLVGFRGFGLCRTDVRVPWAMPEEEHGQEAHADLVPVEEARQDESPSNASLVDAHPAAAIFEAGSQGEAQAAEEPVAAEERSDPQQHSPEEAPEPEPGPARMAFFTMGGSINAWMGESAPLPLKVVEDEPAPEMSAPSEEARGDAPVAEAETPPDAGVVDAPVAETLHEKTPPEEALPAEEPRETTGAEAVPEVAASEPTKPIDPPRSGVKPLSTAERSAFREIAKALGARFEDEAPAIGPVVEEEARIDEAPTAEAVENVKSAPDEVSAQEPASYTSAEAEAPEAEAIEAEEASEAEASSEDNDSNELASENLAEEPAEAEPAFDDARAQELAAASASHDIGQDIGQILDRLPFGVIVHRGEAALFANRAILDLIGYEDLAAFVEEGGLPRLFRARPAALAHEALDVTAPLAIGTRSGDSLAVEVRLTTVDWEGAPASMLTLREVAESDPDLRLRAMELDMLAREQRLRDQSAILDTATDGVIVLDDRGRILSVNRAAEALFGYEQNEVAGEPLMLLLATESHLAALDYLEGMRGEGMQSLLNDGREVIARVRQGGTIPLFMTLGRVGNGGERKFCAVLRDITAFKKAEGELIAAKRAAEHANAQKSDFLAKISHEIRTPLNAIIGFAEVMIEERFGAIGNERYKDYVSDIHSSGQHVISLVNDLLDLAKIEAGRMELTFTSVKVNELVTACVALLQPQAANDRIVLRTSFADRLPPVVADERSLRQITLNLLSNAVKFTDAGGQVIVSTAMTDAGEVVFRVRDTGIGMSETEVEAALEPFRQLATSRKGGGTGLGLPLTKALVEANRGALTISSRKNEGTLVEVVFPPTRVLAE